MEQYDASYTFPSGGVCGSAVSAFLSAWSSQLQADGYIPAAYGAPANAANWNANLSSTSLADIWVAKDDSRATIWGMNYGLTDSMWPSNQRIHQYATNYVDTWGGLQLTDDLDIENAGVAGSSGQKYYTFAGPNSFNCFGSFEGNGINNSGIVVGAYEDSNFYLHGFFYNSTSQGCSAMPDAPGNANTTPFAVNNQGIVVVDGDSSVYLYNINTDTYSSTNPSCPGLIGGSGYFTPSGINDDGQIVGYYYDSSYNQHGVLYPSCIAIDYPNANGTQATGINGQGLVVGDYLDANYYQHGFVYNPATGEYSAPGSLDYPGALATFPNSINNDHMIVGYWQETVDRTDSSLTLALGSGQISIMTLSTRRHTCSALAIRLQ